MTGARVPIFLVAALVLPLTATAQSSGNPGTVPARSTDAVQGVPDLTELSVRSESEVAPIVERYSADRAALGRRWDVEYSPTRRARFRAFYERWLREMDELAF